MSGSGQFRRTVIVGNGGSGKSWLAERLASQFDVGHIDLDKIHWMPGGFNERCPPEQAIDRVLLEASADHWIIEGVYGWLVDKALPRATALIWLDVPTSECLHNVRSRGLRRGGDNATFAALLEFVSEYETRTNTTSRVAHERMYNGFTGAKFRATSRQEMAKLLDSS